MIDIIDRIFKKSIGFGNAEVYNSNYQREFNKNGIEKFLLSYSAWQSDDLLNFMPEMSEQVKQLDQIQELKEAERKFNVNHSRIYEPTSPENLSVIELKTPRMIVEETNWQGRILAVFLLSLAVNVGYSIYKIYKSETSKAKFDQLICQAQILLFIFLLIVVHAGMMLKFTHHPMGNKEFVTCFIFLFWVFICNLGLYNEIRTEPVGKMPRVLTDVK